MGGTRSALLRRERGKRCVTGWSGSEPWAVGEVIPRTRGNRRNSSCVWTRIHDALCYLVPESIDHVEAEPKKLGLEAGEGCVTVAHDCTLGLRTEIACLLSLSMVADERPLCSSCHVPDRATNVPFLCGTNADICVSYGLSGAVCRGCGPNRRSYPFPVPRTHTGEVDCRGAQFWGVIEPEMTDKSRSRSQWITHLELIGSVSTLKIMPPCPRLGFVRFELTSDGASFKISKARVVEGGGGHVC